MNSSCEPEFWDLLNALPPKIKSRAEKAYELWGQDPSHPSLYFKPIPNRPHIWSARISDSYRALCVRDGETCVWFYIGKHDDYERLIS